MCIVVIFSKSQFHTARHENFRTQIGFLVGNYSHQFWSWCVNLVLELVSTFKKPLNFPHLFVTYVSPSFLSIRSSLSFPFRRTKVFMPLYRILDWLYEPG